MKFLVFINNALYSVRPYEEVQKGAVRMSIAREIANPRII